MGKAYSHLVRRPVANWNIEEKAMKTLDKMEKTKPTVAPKHPSSAQYIDRVAQENPGVTTELKSKDDNLIKNMGDMFANPDKVGEIVSKRPLPTNKRQQQSSEFGYEEPENISPGKTSIKKAMEMISQHHMDKDTYNVEYLAEKYKLDKDQVTRIITYFHIFQLQMPQGSKASEMLQNPEFGAQPAGFLKEAKQRLFPESK